MANTASTWQYVVVTWPLRGFSQVLPQNPEMAIRGSYEAALRKGLIMPWSHLCVKSPRMSHVLKTNYGNQNELRDINEDVHVNAP